MVELTRAVRRALVGLVLLTIGQLILDGIDPYGVFSVASRAIQILLAVGLLVGIVPGSYLSTLIRGFTERASSVSPRRVMFVAIGAPLLILAIYVYFAIGELALVVRIGDEPTLLSLLFSLLMVLVQLAILGLNVVDVRRGSSAKSPNLP